MLDKFALKEILMHYVEYFSSIISAESLEELDDVYNSIYTGFFEKSDLRGLYKERKAELERRVQRENNIEDSSKLVNGDYYYIFANGEKASVTLEKPDEFSLKPKEYVIPVIARYSNSTLKEIITGKIVSLNPLDDCLFYDGRIFADYVTKINTTEMKELLPLFKNIFLIDKHKYESEMKEKYGSSSLKSLKKSF